MRDAFEGDFVLQCQHADLAGLVRENGRFVMRSHFTERCGGHFLRIQGIQKLKAILALIFKKEIMTVILVISNGENCQLHAVQIIIINISYVMCLQCILLAMKKKLKQSFYGYFQYRFSILIYNSLNRSICPNSMT